MEYKTNSIQRDRDSQDMLTRDNYFFQPKKSYGWLVILVLSVLFGLCSWVSYLAYQITDGIGAFFSIVLFAGLAVFFMLLLIWFFTMKYELTGDQLIIHFGPFSYAIDLYLVENVEIKNLAPGLGIGLLLPGFAKWVNSYRHEGKVFMCSTRATREIIVLTTKNGKIGITPEYEAEFIEEINKRMQFVKLLESK